MADQLLDPAGLAVLIGSLIAGYLLCDLLVTWLTRPRRLRPAPPTPDLWADPPAVANLLANRGRPTEDAAESTLVDLVARRYLELRQPGNNPRQTTVHLRKPHEPEQLTPFEHRMAERVRSVMVDEVVPVSALTFRDQHEARTWQARFRREVTERAELLGYFRPRLPGWARRLLRALAITSWLAMCGGAAAVASRADEDVRALILAPAFVTGLVLTGVSERRRRPVLNPAGLAAAEHWLGVRAWLLAHPEFRQLPPAAAAVWDRYLSYGAALGVTAVTSRAIHLGLARRRMLWSSYGGQWHRIRVRYPTLLPWYGRSLPQLAGRAARAFGLGGLILAWGLSVATGAAPGLRIRPWLTEDTAPLLAAAGGLAVLYGLVLVALSVADGLTARTLTGQVLWRELWRHRLYKGQVVEWLLYLAVDEGRSDRTTAWLVAPALSSRLRSGDTVTLRARRFTRRVIAVDQPHPPTPDRSAGTDRALLPG